MPKLEYFVVAESASIDQLTNRVSLFNVYDQIIVPGSEFPVVLGSFICVCAWNAEKCDKGKHFQASITIETPDGKQGPFKSNFVVNSRRHRSLLNFSGILVSKPGSIIMDLMLDGTHIASHTIDILSSEAVQ